jgi:virulence factor Mce-like protein
MRRLRALAAAAVIVVLVVVAMAFRSTPADEYRVDVIFDTAKGIVPGQLVKIAGARVGKVDAVELVPGPRAKVGLRIARRFEPFRSDARCQILPEGFISENYVECDPGSSVRPLATPQGGAGSPTVPVEQTAVPVSLQDVINVFSLPVDQRIRTMITTLGLGTAGRGGDLNAILRRANPALTEAGRALGILRDQRRELGDAVTQTDSVLERLAARRQDVGRFVSRAESVTAVTAAHQDDLQETIRRLPPLLTSADDGLRALRRAASSGVPVLRQVRGAAPALTDVTTSLPAFARFGLPAVRELGSAAARGRRAVRSARPVVSSLRRFAQSSGPTMANAARLFDSLAKQGGIEAVLRWTYQLATMSSGYDKVSHYVGVYINVYAQCLMNLKARGCSHAYKDEGNGTIPTNAPSAGPRKVGSYVPSGTDLVTTADQRRMVQRDPAKIKALLEYLLR